MKQTFECNVDPPEGVFRICNCIPQDEVGFGEWEEWSVCSENCGFGTRRRSRDCDDETNCSENEKKEDVGECIRERCPIHGKLSEWGPWQRCNATCGPYGVSIRKRECIDPLYGGLNCSALGPLEEKQNCNDDKFCIVKGGWTPWSKWGLCDPICNPMKSIKKRTRKCENPKPEFTNEDCKGSSVQEQKCTEAEECTPCIVRLGCHFPDKPCTPPMQFKGAGQSHMAKEIQEVFESKSCNIDGLKCGSNDLPEEDDVGSS